MANITKPIGLSNVWAAGGTKIDPGATKVNIGWVVQLPPYEYQNWIDNRQDRAIAHINQHGVAEWDATTEYQGLLSYTQGSDGIIYKCLQTNTNKDPSNTLNNLFWAVAFEQYGSVAVVSSALSAHITNYQTLSGIGNLSAARSNLSVYSKVESDTRFAGLNGSSGQVFSVAVATQPEHAVRLGQVASLLTQSTESVLGVVKLATTGLTESGVDDLTAITPLKGNAVYVKKSGNLAGLSNYATARTNLGLGTAAVQNVEVFAQVSNNLSDLASATSARSNLGLTSTATQPENYFLRSGQNLADLPSVSLARTNLGLTSTAVTPLSSILLKADNLSGLSSASQARSNLGLGTASTFSDTAFLKASNNLSDLTNKQAAQNNLGLDFSSVQATNGSTNLPNGLVMKWGQATVTYNQGRYTVTFAQPFPNACFNVIVSVGSSIVVDGVMTIYVDHTTITKNSFVAVTDVDEQAGYVGRVFWQAIGN